ncbi:MAG: hypothetical protein GWN61_26320, partial [candidate division Zixibacteria bacterium]|nr:hypothetical protein [candidate division Zixibacteria bacterium]NIR68162.1 hypothetical protein [candidate division Zixibacteria bacterium]NIS17895.1 hypothetical protein [candidate division Zixibacteria bacterium]NIS49374.1 hypothetical protein [candidate division Zixibacteria bacterium]NIU17452.1 hypothetical protein [candidate division Zixibacteria bacterium]
MKKTALITFMIVFISGLALGQSPSVDQILDRHAEALGGMDAIRDFKSFHYQAKIQLGNLAGSAETWLEKPEKFKVKIDLAIMKMEQGMYEDRIWMKDQTGTIRDMAGIEKQQFITEFQLGSYNYLLDPEIRQSFTFVGVEEFNDKGCYVMDFQPPGGDKFTIFFDTLNYLSAG